MADALFCSWTFLLVCILPIGQIHSSPARIVTSSSQPFIAGGGVTSNLVSEYAQTAPSDGRTPQTEAIRRMREMLGRAETEDSKGLKRVFLSKDNVTCNDGSPAGFYIRKSQSSKKWIIFLEGGWYCYDQRSCHNRWLRLRNFMTSKQWAETRNVGGILSQNPEENPYWWNANHIFVPYCSSDSWSGTRLQPHRWHHQPEGTVKYAFMGSYIVQEVIKDLLPLGLAQATTLILAGSSAGGTGVIVNLDRVADNLADLGHGNIEVRGLADSGWFLDNAPFSSGSSTSSSTFASSWLVTSPAQAVKKGVELWRGKVPERCREDYPEEVWRCYFGYRVYPTLKAPLFVFQWLFDEAQMTADNVGAPVTKEQWDYIHRTGDNLRKTFENVTGLFAASCISHTVLTKRDWQAIRLGDATLPQTLNCWEMHHLRQHKGKDSRESHQSNNSHHHKHQPHHGHHHNHGHVTYTQTSEEEERSGNVAVESNADFTQLSQTKRKNVTVELIWNQEDHTRDPILSYTGNREVTTSTWNPLVFTNSGENTTMLGDAPISSTMKYSKNAKSGMHKSSTSTSTTPSHPVISTPASVISSHRSVSRKCSGENSEVLEREGTGGKVGREGKGEDKKHRRKGKRKRKRRRRRRRKKKGEEEEDERGSKEAGGGPKHRRGGGNRASKGGSGEGHRGRRKNVGRGTERVRRSEFSNEKVQWLRGGDGKERGSLGMSEPRGHRRGASHCSHRLLERCTWPQCNHSCPKLHNPFTGEEMDFIELLKSFGLDMASVANALGIDIHTLNNMDHDELLNLLTQQSN